MTRGPGPKLDLEGWLVWRAPCFVCNLNFECLCCCYLVSCIQLFYDSMDYSPPGSFIHGISQARVLEWVAISFSRGSFNARTEFACPATPALAGGFWSTAPPGTTAYGALRIWHLPTSAISGPINPLPTHYFPATLASLLFLKHINHTTTLGALCLLGIPSLSFHAHSLPSFKSSMVAKEISWTITCILSRED